MRARSTAWHCWLWGGVAPALGVTVAVRRVPVLRHAQRTRAQAYFVSKVSVGVCGPGGGPGVDSVRDGVLDPLALSEVVGLLESMLRRLLPCAEFQGGVQTVPKAVWRFLEVQKTIEISLLQFIDKVLPYVVAQRQIPMVLRHVQTVSGSRRAEYCRGSAVAGMVDVCWCSSSTVVYVLVLLQRRGFACSSWTRSLTCPLCSQQGVDVPVIKTS